VLRGARAGGAPLELREERRRLRVTRPGMRNAEFVPREAAACR
jgi:hypothetical protein